MPSGLFGRLFGVDNANPIAANNPLPVQVVTGTSSVQGGIATYMASSAYVTPYATPTDLFTIAGSATKLVTVLGVFVNGTQTTAGVNQFFLRKRSAANTGGASTALTAIPLDSTAAAATATPVIWTAAPTITGDIGAIAAISALTPAPASIGTGDAQLFVNEAPVALRGVAQTLALNFAGAAVPAGMSISVTVVWIEQ